MKRGSQNHSHKTPSTISICSSTTTQTNIDKLEERLQQFVLKTIKDKVEEQVSKIQENIDKQINDLDKMD